MNVLLSHALLDLTRASERAGAEQPVQWSNVLRVVGDDGVDRKAMPQLVRLSKRVVTTTVDGMARRGWASIEGGQVRLTDIARQARDDWGAAIVRAEAAWPGASVLRPPLEGFVAALPLEHPHYYCGYGSGDWRITGGPGIDWKAVPRDTTTDTVSSLPLLALLSQALVGLAVEYESRMPFALIVGVYFDAIFADGPVPLDEIPRALMVAGNGKSSLERHGALHVDDAKQVTLTALGRYVRDGYRQTVDAIECSWPAAAALRSALEHIDVHHAGHADHPDVQRVGGHVGFAEVSARADQRG